MNITATLKNVNVKNQIGTIYIYIDLYSKSVRNRIFYQTPHKVESRLFKNGKVIGRTVFANDLNNRIQDEINTVKDIIRDLTYEGKEINKNSLIDARNKKNEGIKDLITLANEYIQIRTDAKPKVIEKLNNLVTRLQEFQKGKPLYYSEIDQKFVNNFTQFLQKFQQPSTIQKTFSFLRQILNHYFINGVIDDNFKKLKYPKGFFQRQMIFTESEIKQLISYTPTSKRIEKVKDLCLCQLFTGLRYSDAVKLNKSNIYNDFLNITTKKTNQRIEIPLHENLKKLLEKYNFDLSSLKISNVKYNDYIKELIELAGITSKSEYIYFVNGQQVTTQKYKYDLVSSHTFRRTFITNAIIQGIPLHVIQSITGHTTLKQLTEYVNIANEVKKVEMNKLNSLFSV